MKKARTAWPPETVEVLKQHLAAGLTYAQIAKAMDSSRGGVATAVRVYVQGITDDRKGEARRSYERLWWRERSIRAGTFRGGVTQPTRWTEETLTEPYAVRKLRKQAEASR